MRKRRGGEHVGNEVSSNQQGHGTVEAKTQTVKIWHWKLVLILGQSLSFFCLLAGVWMDFKKLYTASDCRMTYSRRQFLSLDIANHEKYRMFKFMDARDPRHRSYIRGKSAEGDTDWCFNNVTTVLYVPGHFGSYEQSRSLGAHGIQLTERGGGTVGERSTLLRLNQMTINDKVGSGSDWFFYDVYALDFREEGGAFHGSLLQRQAAYIAQVVTELTETCDIQRVHIVAHSIGGISSRLAMQLYPSLQDHVHDIITLGTPHRVPVWTWEPSMWNIYVSLKSKEDSLAILSISGGLRDEMIPAEACFAGDTQATVLSSQLTPNATLGMDHKAIVWCYNVLSEVRSVLFALIESGTTEKDELVELLRKKFSPASKDYFVLCQEQVQTMKVSQKSYDRSFSDVILPQELYGYLIGTLMETGLLHNAEHIVFLFTVIGSLRYLQVSRPLCVLSCVGLLLLKVMLLAERNLSPVTAILLGLASYTLHDVVNSSIFLLSRLRSRPISSKKLAIASLLTTFVTGLAMLFTKRAKVINAPSTGLVFFSFYTLFAVIVKGTLHRFGTNDKVQDRQLSLTALLLPILPLLVLGDILVMPDRLASYGSVFILIPLSIRFSMAGSMHTLRARTRGMWWSIFNVSRWLLLLHYLWSVLSTTTTYRMFHPMALLLMGFATVDATEQSLVWL